MNDRGGSDDDPDEVTLWAGRLRAWPAPPSTGDLDGTARSARAGTAAADDVAEDGVEDTAFSARRGAGALGAAGGGLDDTQLSARRGAGTVGAAGGALGDTQLSARRGAGVAGAAGETFDDTVRSPRARAAATGEVPASDSDDTVRSARAGTGASDALPPDRHGRVGPETPESPDADASAVPGEPREEQTAPSRTGRIRFDGSRGVSDAGAGRTRRPTDAGPAGGGRQASVPDVRHSYPYAPRLDGALRVARTPAARASSIGEAVAASPRRARGRSRLVLLSLVIALVAAAAALGVVLLLG